MLEGMVKTLDRLTQSVQEIQEKLQGRNDMPLTPPSVSLTSNVVAPNTGSKTRSTPRKLRRLATAPIFERNAVLRRMKK